MKHRFLPLAAFALLTVVSCTEEDTFQENRITRVSADLPEFLEEDGTRSQINVSASDKITYTWAIGDVLGIFPDDGMQSYFRLTESTLSADGKSATFDGGAWALKNGHSFYAYFPFSYENSQEISTFSAIPVDYTGQSITAWGDTKNAGHYDFLAAGATTPSGGALSFSFERLSALFRLKLALPATGTYKELTLSTDADVIPVKGKVDLSATPLVYTPETYASSISLNLNNISGTEGQEVFVYMMLPPMALNTQGKTLVVTLSHDKGSSNYLIYKTGESVSVTPDFKANTTYKRDTSPQTVEADGGLSSYGYVDLGLPSGLLWATCNVGASSPEDYGDYYAWGETETKSTYDDSTYKWCNGSSSTFTKYCSNSSFGTVDNKTVLELSDDVAHEKWGGSWRIPTFAEWGELRTSCTWTWAYQNGKNGYIVTGPNGKFIFLPAAGYYADSSLKNLGSFGDYWSSTLHSDANYPYLAYVQTFNNSLIWDDASSSRDYGRSVRPVLSSSSLFPGMVTGITFDNPSLSLKAGETKTLSVTVAPSDATTQSVTWSSSNPSVATVSASGVVTAVGSGTALITVTSTDGGGVKASCSVTVPTLSNGYECVDMGLPSGTQWAACNVGASSPEEYGDYFAWGETETKSSYEWASYPLDYNGQGDDFTKYCTSSSYGMVDNKTVLDPSDDAARVKWGGYWRMPTNTELIELIDNCTWTWTTRNGKNGYLVTSSNGNSIFLPAAGCRIDSSFGGAGSEGYYWSSSLYTSKPDQARSLYITSRFPASSRISRCWGQSVRPVISASDLSKVLVTGITLDKTSLTLEEDDSYTLSATVAPSNATDKTVTWTSLTPAVASVSASGVVTALKAGTATIKALANDGSGVNATCSVTVTPSEYKASGVYNGHDYVDLGLPSGLKWATCNVGASSPEAYGNFYAWGETETKSSYNWSNNRWGISENSLTKYCTDSSRGTVDNKTTLESTDDVAHVKWGGDWRMPTDAEMTELIGKCTWTWTTYRGKNGYKVTGSNGNSIFLPAAGIRTGTAYQFADCDGYYWSSSLDTSNPGSARHLQFAFNYFYMIQSSRSHGFPVRPVCL